MKLPRFSLRELFLLVLVAALTCAWWLERRRYGLLEPHFHRLSEQYKSLIDGLGEEGIGVHPNPTTGETLLEKIGPGKVRCDAQRTRLNEEIQNLPDLEITPGSARE